MPGVSWEPDLNHAGRYHSELITSLAFHIPPPAETTLSDHEDSRLGRSSRASKDLPRLTSRRSIARGHLDLGESSLYPTTRIEQLRRGRSDARLIEAERYLILALISSRCLIR